MKAIFVWHYYEDCEIVGYSVTHFEGDWNQFRERLKEKNYGSKDAKDSKVTVILHQLILL